MNKQTILRRFILPIVGIAFLCAMPTMVSPYNLSVLIFLFINLILVVSYRFVTNMGLWSFAHISSMGIGAYTAGLLVTRLGWPFWGALPIAVLASALVGLIIGLPCLRTRGFYFFLSTFAAGEAIRWAWILFREPFGSYSGIGVIPRPEQIPGMNFALSTSYYYLALGFTLLSLVILYRLEKSRIGATVNAIRSSEDLSESIGINTPRYQTAVFATASAFAGLAGVLLAFYTGTITPNSFSFMYSMEILVFVIVGGPTSFFGPIVGACALTAVGEALSGFMQYMPLVYGTVLICVVLFQPDGLINLPKRILSLVEKYTGRRMAANDNRK